MRLRVAPLSVSPARGRRATVATTSRLIEPTTVSEGEQSVRELRPDAWWLSHDADVAHVYTVQVEEAASVVWALQRGELTLTRWSARAGLKEATRSYP